MLITFFPRLWHGNCTAFTAEHAEGAEKGTDGGKAKPGKKRQNRTSSWLAASRKASGGFNAENGGDWGKANGKRRNGTAFTAEIAESAEKGGECGEQRTRKPEPGNRKKGAKDRGPEMREETANVQHGTFNVQRSKRKVERLRAALRFDRAHRPEPVEGRFSKGGKTKSVWGSPEFIS